jgi:anaerobic C4-dicarboxylate transporter
MRLPHRGSFIEGDVLTFSGMMLIALTLRAPVPFDQTGTTRIGKYLPNHSFMLPWHGNGRNKSS